MGISSGPITIKWKYWHTLLKHGFWIQAVLWWEPEWVIQSDFDQPTHPSGSWIAFFFHCCAVSPPQLFPPQQNMYDVPVYVFPHPPIKNVCVVYPLPCSSVPLPHSAQSWILSKVKNLASSSLFYRFMWDVPLLRGRSFMTPAFFWPFWTPPPPCQQMSDLNQHPFKLLSNFSLSLKTWLCFSPVTRTRTTAQTKIHQKGVY